MTLQAEQSAPPATRGQRLVLPLVTGGSVLAATVALHFRDPHVQGSWGLCPFTALTGLYCPGCGGLRAVNDLGNFDLAGAASSNLLFVVLIPMVLALYARSLLTAWDGVRRPLPPGLTRTALIVLAVGTTAFWVARNLPGSWLAP